MGGGITTFQCTSNPIRNCCGGGPSNPQRPQSRAATLNYRSVPSCPNISKTASLGRDSVYFDTIRRGDCEYNSDHENGYRDAVEIHCRYRETGTCDIVKSGLSRDIPDNILWKFEGAEENTNDPDVIGRTLPNAIVNTTTL
ncbi:hypothetical protein HHI36_018304 [Cryptolaemus montrouzieri]|uniref:Uncharacterized protein n=1 Tax=Cryptolaemus montrouzieri TaxID=559131 RepID=A0ABD2NZZ1_9CUCU